MPSELYFLSARQLTQFIKEKKISCVELIQIHLARIAKINAKLNAIIQLQDPEKTLQEARIADKKLAQQQMIGPLHGITHHD